MKKGRYVLIPTSEKTRGHRTHSLPELWKEHLARLLAESGQITVGAGVGDFHRSRL